LKSPCVYILANKRNGTLYTGVTSDLLKRVAQHKSGAIKGFAKQYDCKSLVWYEVYDDMTNAIQREKQIKAGSRIKKVSLIESQNPDWSDLYDSIL